MDARTVLTSSPEKGRRVHDLDLRGADLDAIDCSRLHADRLDLRTASLRQASLHAVRFSSCQFQASTLEAADCSGATWRSCRLDGAHAAGARFDGARLEDSTADGIDLACASLRGAHLSETSFNRAVMRGAVLDAADGEGVEFRGADLRSATLIGARFDAADFRGADLRGADFSRGRFRGADFRGAVLDDAKFDDADCAAAQFDINSGPRASGERQDPTAATTRFDEPALAMMRELMTQLPALLVARQGPAAELLAQLQAAIPTLDAAASCNAEAWQSWAERVVESGTVGEAADLRAFLTALTDAPIGMRLGASRLDPESAAAVVDRLQASLGTLGSSTDQPPEEWQPVLRTLMGMTAGDRSVDVKALLDQLASLGKSHSTTVGPRKP